jgi:hypothetical protein
MIGTLIRPVFMVAALCVSMSALAQQQPPPEELEPAVDTSADTTTEPAPAPGAVPASTPPAPQPAASQPAAPPPPAREQGRSGQRVMDRLELDATQITGNRELPKVLYIVPWKRSDLGDLVGRPVNSLLDEVLAPVDRDVFKRENRYYTALQPGRGGAASGSEGDASQDAPDDAPPARDER